MCISCPFQLHTSQPYTESWLRNPLGRFINWYLLGNLKDLVERQQQTVKDTPIMMPKVRKSLTIREFEDNVVCKLFPKYPTHREYWEDANSFRFIPNIKTPTLFVNASDDPVVAQV